MTTSQVGTAVTGSLAARLARLRALRGPGVADFTARVREVVLVASSSRGGSSMLSELLRHSPLLLHLRAEVNPFLRLAGLAYPASGSGSDRLDEGHLAGLDTRSRRLLDTELALDAGRPDVQVDDDQFVLDVGWRFAVQWPEVEVDLADWLEVAHRVLATVRREHQWRPGRIGDAALFHVELFRALRARGIAVDAGYYDLPRRYWSDVDGRRARGAPGAVVVEEPPFVLTRPWRRAVEGDLAKPLVIKTPSNAFRLRFLRALFPGARIRVLHLTRNPAAAVNGLLDGWWHGTFHAHRMPAPLNIGGYATDRPADRWWWKFDLPPGWEDYTSAPLREVCAFQWRRCHRAVLDDIAAGGLDHIRIAFEDLIRGDESRVRTMARVSDWLGVPFDGAFLRAVRRGIDPVVATVPPAPSRWRRRADLIRPVLGSDVRLLAKELGYGAEDGWL